MPAILEMPTVAPRTVHQPAKTVLTGKELLILELERIQYEKMMGEVSVVDYNQCCFYSPYDQPKAMTIECCLAGLVLVMEIGVSGIERLRTRHDYRPSVHAISVARNLLGLQGNFYEGRNHIFKSPSLWPYELGEHYVRKSRTEAGIMALNQMGEYGDFPGKPTFSDVLKAAGKTELEINQIVKGNSYHALRVFHIIHSHLFDNVTQFR